jgi:aspartate 1-decarboxylase
MVIILAYAVVGDEEARSIEPKLVYVDEQNAIVPRKELSSAGKI